MRTGNGAERACGMRFAPQRLATVGSVPGAADRIGRHGTAVSQPREEKTTAPLEAPFADPDEVTAQVVTMLRAETLTLAVWFALCALLIWFIWRGAKRDAADQRRAEAAQPESPGQDDKAA
jgi:hypothetical protein